MNINQLISELKDSDKTVISDRHGSLTGRQLAARIESLSADLDSLGIKDKRVCLLRMTNNIDSVSLLLAALLNRAVVFINNPYDPIQKVYQALDRFSVYALIADKASSLTINKKFQDGHAPQVHAIEGLDRYATLYRSNDVSIADRDRRMAEADVAIFSSGSTGEPKAILHKLENLLLNARLHIESIGLTESDRLGISLPLYYSYGLVANLFSGLIAKAEIHLTAQVGAIDNDWLEEKHITVISITPFMAKKITRSSGCLRTITVGGDVFYSKHAAKLLELFPDCAIYSTYGLTEAGPRVATCRITEQATETNFIMPLGNPMKDVRLALRNNAQTGELLVETPTPMIGYFYGSDKGFIPKTGADNIVETGDLYENKFGHYYFAGREKKIITQGGEKLFPLMIESVISSIEGVVDVLVDSLPHAEHGEIAKAYIVTNKQLSEDYVKKEMLKNIARSHMPQQMEFVESISRTVTGKLYG